MGEVLDALDIIGIAVLVIVLLAQSAGFVFWVRFEITQIRKDMKETETQRTENVKHLRDIYDLKIEESKAYSKGLFEVNTSDHIAIKEKMVGIEKTLQKILDLLMTPNNK